MALMRYPTSSALGASYITVEIDPDEGDKKK